MWINNLSKTGSKVLFIITSTCFVIACKKEVTVTKTLPKDIVSSPAKKYEINTSKVIWSDEFNVIGLPDSTKWVYDKGGNGWGNQELQNYTDKLSNAEVKDGMLFITAVKEKTGNNNYSSARLTSKKKGDFLYGRIEVKAKLPKGRGTWPAIWMLATDQNYGSQYWPDNGEIDIMEHVGFDQNIVHGNIHTKSFNHSIGTNKGDKTEVKDASDSFNIYAVNWFPDNIIFEINGREYFRFSRKSEYIWNEWPFDKPFHVLLNIAVGGTWGGQKGIDESVYPQSMLVDYVRVYGIQEVK